MSATDVLVETRSFFVERVARGAFPWNSGLESDDTVCSAIARIALVAAERYVRAEMRRGRDVPPRLRAGVKFRSTGRLYRSGDPSGLRTALLQASVSLIMSSKSCIQLPNSGCGDEEGLALSRSELLATIERREVIDEDHDVDYLERLLSP